MKSISRDKTIRDIISLTHLAEINLEICKKIYKHIDIQKQNEYYYFFLIAANNAFNESIGIIHTLFCSKKDEEVRIRPILEEIINQEKHSIPTVDQIKVEKYKKVVNNDYSINGTDYSDYTFLSINYDRPFGDIMSDIKVVLRVKESLSVFEEIKNNFELNKFHKIRHQGVAHKNKYLDNPAYAPIGRIYNEYIEKLDEIIKKMRINTSLWFNYNTRNQFLPTLISLEKTMALTIDKK